MTAYNFTEFDPPVPVAYVTLRNETKGPGFVAIQGLRFFVCFVLDWLNSVFPDCSCCIKPYNDSASRACSEPNYQNKLTHARRLSLKTPAVGVTWKPLLGRFWVYK